MRQLFREILNAAKRCWCLVAHYEEERFWCTIRSEWRCPRCGTTWGD